MTSYLPEMGWHKTKIEKNML